MSRANAPELDSWITQARRLHTDIAASYAKADEILELARAEEALEQESKDSMSQARLLEEEIRFNNELAAVLGRLQLIGATLAQVERVMGSDLGEAITMLTGVDDALEKMGGGPTIVVALMREQAAELRKGLRDKVDGGWGGMIEIDKQEGSIKIQKDVTGMHGGFFFGRRMGLMGHDSGGISGESVVEALRTLDILDSKVDQLHQQIDTLLITPRLDMSKKCIPAFSVDGDTLRIIGRSSDLSANHMFTDLRLIFTFLNSNLPKSITTTLSRILVPSLTTRLRTTTLSQSIPSSLDDLPEFEALLDGVRKFEDYLQEINWTEETELREWADRAPKVWLAKKTETSLDKLRTIIAHGIAQTKVVERTETQKIKKHDRNNSVVAEDAWNEDWKDEDETPSAAAKEVTKSLQVDVDDDEEASGWGLDEDLDIEEDEPPKEEEPEKQEEEKPAEEGLEELDWGEWGEDVDEPSKPQTPVTADFTPSTTASEANSSSPHTKPTSTTYAPHSSSSRDVTLREHYTVTSIPDAVLEIIIQVMTEATRLSTLPTSSITPAARGLLSLPTLILAAYRALAPIHYAVDTASNMYLYNDCVRLSEELANIDTQQGLTFTATEKSDVALISLFGKRTYAKEIASQRIILTDYLDGTQGFVRCTEYPQSLACETAISSVISRLREIHASWSPVLSQSALSQAIGSLLNTVVVRLIHDVEDMSDIPEAESVKLAGFMEELGKLESLFPEGPRGVSTTGVYCSNWIKFRFLQQVLESTMADILYMFKEGHLEGFEEGALCDLVRALFADSENRRKCIDEIRRGRL